VKHRGVSEVTGSVIMLGIVGAISALILTSGLSAVTNFSQFLIDVDLTEEFLEERFVVEFVEFKDMSDDVDIYVRNIGLNAVTISTISIVNVGSDPTQSQNAILLPTTITSDNIIQPRTRGIIDINLTTCLISAVKTDFDSTLPLNACTDTTYRITLVTDRGNIYSIEAVPFRA